MAPLQSGVMNHAPTRKIIAAAIRHRPLSACAQGGQVENIDQQIITVAQFSARSQRHNRLSQVAPRQWRRFCILLTPIKRMALGGARTAGFNGYLNCPD